SASMLSAKHPLSISIRLRHLNAIRGCKFAVTYADREAISAALFTFFAALHHGSVVLFEMEVHLSGLVLLDAEFYDLHSVSSHSNQVYFQFANGVYTSPLYFRTEAGTSPVHSWSSFKTSPRISYDWNTIQKFILFSEFAKAQLHLMKSETEMMLRLKTSLSEILATETKREVSRIEMKLLEYRLRTAQCAQSALYSKLNQLSKERRLAEDKLYHTRQATCLLQNQYDSFSKSISDARSRLSQMDHVLYRRTVILLREMIDLFDEQLFLFEPKRGGAVALDKSEDIEYSHAADLSPPDTTSLSFGIGQTSNSASQQSHTNLTELTPVPQDLRLPSASSETTDAHSLAIGSGFVAYLLRVLSAVLNQPLRYPVDIRDGFSRAKIVDRLAPDLIEAERSFPLYLPRSSLLTSYKHALFLLSRDLTALRAICGFGTSNDDAVVHNFRTLLRQCASNQSAVRLT
ncbi:unnamed protein product, partial [Dicrocoelium dendriticum]